MPHAYVIQALSLTPPPFDYCVKLLPRAVFHGRPFSNNCFLSGSLHVLATVPRASVAGGEPRMTNAIEWKDCGSLWRRVCILERCTDTSMRVESAWELKVVPPITSLWFSCRRPPFSLSHPLSHLTETSIGVKITCLCVNACMCCHLDTVVFAQDESELCLRFLFWHMWWWRITLVRCSCENSAVRNQELNLL